MSERIICVLQLKPGKRAAIFLKRVAVPLPTQYTAESQVKLQELVFNIAYMGWGGEVRQVKLYSCLVCAQKRQKCKIVHD